MGRGGVSLPWIARLVLLVLLAAGIAWLSLTSYLPRIDARLSLGGARPADTFTDAGRELIDKKGQLDDATYTRLADAARQDPLASEPFLMFGFRALGAGNLESAQRLLEEARNRDPRNQFARIALMGLYLRTGRIREGSDEVAALIRILPRASQLLVPELARLAAAPATRQSVVDAIGDEPIMASVLERMVEQDADSDLILALSARQPAPANGEFAPWQQTLLKKLADRGDVSRSYDLWRRFVGANPTDLVYDPNFTGMPGPLPFNWEYTASDVGAAERAREGGLDIEFFGRKSGTLARQLLMLRPGRYRLQFQAEGNATGQGARILVRVACRDAEQALVEIPLQGLTYSPKANGADLTVPAGCAAQWLSFDGQAVEFPSTQRAKITALAVRPAS